MNSDFNEILSIFNANQVKYLIIGGHAVSEYAEPRYTKDLDIWVEATAQNAQSVFRSLKEFGAPLFELKPSDFAEEGTFYQMGRAPARIDILMSIDGLSFNEAWGKRQVVSIFGEKANLISLEDLITAKRSAGRPQDLIDLDNLLMAREIKNRS